MKDGIKRRFKVNDRLTANDGVCAFEGCKEPRYTSLHSYCIEHRRLVARIAQRKYEANKRAAQHRLHQTAGRRGSKKSKVVVPAAGKA